MEFNENSLEFLNKNNIKFMPIRINSKKEPEKINLTVYKRFKKDGKITYVPNFTEFLDITDELLKKRQSYMNQYTFNCLGIDTYKIHQIDIDTDKIEKKTLDYMVKNFPYYKSVSKYYGYHFFIKIKNYNPISCRSQFVNIFNGVNVGNVELLSGSWGYFKLSSIIQNTEKDIPIFNIDKDFNIYLEDGFTLTINIDKNKISKKSNNKNNINTSPDLMPNQFKMKPYDDEEILDHLNNINPLKYISKYEHHYKICYALFNHGYNSLAFKTINMIVNPNKSKNEFISILNSWKHYSNNTNISIATIFYYSRESDINKYNYLLKKWRGLTLPHSIKKELFSFDLITEILNERYLPSDLLINKIKNNDTEQVIHIKSHLGTGKTTIMKNYIKNNPEKRILYFAPRIAFANDIHSSLKKYGFEIYSDIKSKKDNFNYEKVIIQAESLHRVSNKKYDIIVIDEIESVLKQLTSKDTNKRMTETYITFNNLVKYTNKIISLDAFLSQASINTIRDIKNKHVETEIIVNNFQPYNRKAIELRDFETLLKKAKKQVKKGEKIVFITLSKTYGDRIYQDLKQITENIKFYYGAMSQKNKNFDNVEEDWKKLDVLIYTPIITCGVNFDPEIPHFNSLYIYGTPNSCVVRDLFQSSLRVRKLINNECYFAVSRKNYNYNFKKFNVENIGYENIKNEIIKNQQIINDLGLSIDNIYDWGINNLAFKLNEEMISNHYILEMVYEYFRKCGYEIIPYQHEIKYFKQEDNVCKDIKDFIYIDDITEQEYLYFEKNPNEITEENRWSMLKYDIKLLFPKWEESDDNVKKYYFWEFINDDNRRKNLITEFYKNQNQLYEDIRNNDKYVFDVFINYDVIKKDKINKLLNIFNKNKSYEMNFSQKDIQNNSIDLMNFIEKNRTIFNIKKSQGNNPITYLTSCVKKIFSDWLRVKYKQKLIRNGNKRYNIYYLDLKKTDINIFEEFMNETD